MLYQYSHRLGAYAPSLDPDAKAYIAAVETALSSSISAYQKNAINDFFKTGKSDGWYSSIKRLYLPIWADAAANAIDMISLTSGTFSASGVTHATGYVQGDGSTGYFDIGITQSSQGLTTSSGYQFALCPTASTLGFRGLIGRSQSVTVYAGSLANNVSQLFRWNNTITGAVISSATSTGILSFSRQGGNRSIYRRTASARSVLVNTAGADAGTMPTGGNCYAMALNVNASTGGTAGEFNDAQFGVFGFGLGLTDTNDAAFTLALKDLWETASGLTLP